MQLIKGLPTTPQTCLLLSSKHACIWWSLLSSKAHPFCVWATAIPFLEYHRHNSAVQSCHLFQVPSHKKQDHLQHIPWKVQPVIPQVVCHFWQNWNHLIHPHFQKKYPAIQWFATGNILFHDTSQASVQGCGQHLLKRMYDSCSQSIWRNKVSYDE